MPTASTLLPPELLAQLERLDLVSRKILRGRLKGERRSRRKGQSVEFADYRNYTPGDDLRFLDWNVYARLERLFLRVFLEEEDLQFHALVDTSASMEFGDPSKLRYALQLAAALGFIGLARGHRVRLAPLGGPRQEVPAFRGRHSLWRMLDWLEGFTAAGPTDLATGVRDFCLRTSGQGIVVVLSDLMDKRGYEDALRLLLARRMDVYVLHTLSQEELLPDVRGDLRLVDCEDQDEAEITVSAPLLARYQQTLASFVDGARQFCTRRGMGYLLASTSVPAEQLIGGYLRSRGLVR